MSMSAALLGSTPRSQAVMPVAPSPGMGGGLENDHGHRTAKPLPIEAMEPVKRLGGGPKDEQRERSPLPAKNV